MSELPPPADGPPSPLDAVVPPPPPPPPWSAIPDDAQDEPTAPIAAGVHPPPVKAPPRGTAPSVAREPDDTSPAPPPAPDAGSIQESEGDATDDVAATGTSTGTSTDLPPAEPVSSPRILDPNDLGRAIDDLTPTDRRLADVALVVVAAQLKPGEQVSSAVAGRYQGFPGVAVLTSVRLLLVNEHRWSPDVRVIPISADLEVQGWHDKEGATLVFVVDGRRQSVIIDGINDLDRAQEFARAVRSRVASA